MFPPLRFLQLRIKLLIVDTNIFEIFLHLIKFSLALVRYCLTLFFPSFFLFLDSLNFFKATILKKNYLLLIRCCIFKSCLSSKTVLAWFSSRTLILLCVSVVFNWISLSCNCIWNLFSRKNKYKLFKIVYPFDSQGWFTSDMSDHRSSAY